MLSKRNSYKNKRKTGAGYLSPSEYFNPEARQPSSNAPAISSAPTTGWIRPPMTATNFVSPNVKTGGKRSTRKSRRNANVMTRKNMFGGFSPALMGNFVSNVHSAIVPLVLYGLYTVFGTSANKTAKAVSTSSKNGGASKKASKKNKKDRKAGRKANRKN
jgi:hypothetical protein